ncbi:MAG TPA: Calx-beta domain-containing protein, partial [Nocardioidaceae bacterium]|nr:Calx-beta domain-containing protein [Nocardioidaceae bacterium]
MLATTLFGAPRHGPGRRLTAFAAVGLLTFGLPVAAFTTVGTPSLSVGDVTVTERDGDSLVARVRVALSAKSSHRVTVRYETVKGTARTPADFSAVSGKLRFEPGDKVERVLVPVAGDTRDEVAESFRVRIFSATGASIADHSGTVTILDDDPRPSLRVGSLDVTESDGGSERPMNFPVRLSEASGKPVSVSYEVTEGSATEDDDYVVGDASGTLSFPAGVTSRPVRVQVVGDDDDEVDETVRVSLSDPSNAVLADRSATGTIDDDDGPDLRIDDVKVREGRTAEFTVELSEDSVQDVTFDYDTDEGSAKAPDDYEPTSGTKTIEAGDDETTIRVETEEDRKDEVDEEFSLRIRHVENATVDDGRGLATIDDDDGPRIRIEDATVKEGAEAVIEVELSEPSVQDITFDYDTDEGTAESPQDYEGESGSRTIEAGDDEVRIRIDTERDSRDEVDEKFYVNITDVENASVREDRATVTIRDADGPKVSVDDVSVTEGGDAVFTVTLSEKSVQPVEMRWETDRGTASRDDFSADRGRLVVPAGDLSRQITVKTVDDKDVEPDETFFVRLDELDNATFSDDTGKATIVDDDVALTVGDAHATEGSAVVFEVSLDRDAPATV